MESEELFCEKHLDSIFSKIKNNIKKDVHYYAIHHQLDENTEATIQKLLIQHTINPPQLHESDDYMIAPEESAKSISTMWDKYNNTALANFTFVIPFSGDFEMFYIKTDDQDLDISCDGIVTKNRLLLIYNSEDFESAKAIEEKYRGDVSKIRENLNCIRKATDKFNNNLNNWIKSEIQASKKVENKDKQLKVA